MAFVLATDKGWSWCYPGYCITLQVASDVLHALPLLP